MSKQKYIIPHTTIEKEFSDHLDLIENKRILFSAPFGSGKSYFLKSYFEQSEKYLTVKLHPIDYVVSTNEDIFELIKHDLLLELLDEHYESIDLKKEDVSWLMAGQMYVNSKFNILPFLKIAAKLIEPTGTASEVAEEVEKSISVVQELKKDVSVDEERAIMEFLKREKLKGGSIREMDGITSTIKDFIQRIKDKNPEKELVLIVDDMDRLDPEHIFRLFNIFTAHYDSRTEENKFGFDKVIFVADIQNIKHVFAHRFGPHADFKGYVNKYYSREIFQFDFRKHITEALGAAGNKAKTIPAQEPYDFNTGYNYSTVFQFLIARLVAIDSLNVRSFERLVAYRIPKGRFSLMDGREARLSDYPFLVLVFMLKQFYPSTMDLLKAFEGLYKKFRADYSMKMKSLHYQDERISNLLIEYSLPFCYADQNILFKQGQDFAEFYTNEFQQQLRIEGKVEHDGSIKLQAIKLYLDEDSSLNECIKPNFYWFMFNALENVMKSDFIPN